jgi:hypothetical protein
MNRQIAHKRTSRSARAKKVAALRAGAANEDTWAAISYIDEPLINVKGERCPNWYNISLYITEKDARAEASRRTNIALEEMRVIPGSSYMAASAIPVAGKVPWNVTLYPLLEIGTSPKIHLYTTIVERLSTVVSHQAHVEGTTSLMHAPESSVPSLSLSNPL